MLCCIDAILAKFLVKQAPMNAENVGRLRFVSLRCGQSAFDEGPFEQLDIPFPAVLQRDQIGPVFGGVPRAIVEQENVIAIDDAASRQNQRSRDCVFELADISASDVRKEQPRPRASSIRFDGCVQESAALGPECPVCAL
jgi:hypothetical protein